MAGDETVVEYTVKELLGSLDHKMDTVVRSVAGKADVATVTRLHDRVDVLEEASRTAMAVAEVGRRRANNNRWLIFTAVPTTIAASTAVAALMLR